MIMVHIPEKRDYLPLIIDKWGELNLIAHYKQNNLIKYKV